MSTHHLMLDMETLGTRHGSVIVSLALMEFDPLSASVIAEPHDAKQFCHYALNIEQQFRAGMTADGDTLHWWMAQDDSARRVFARVGMDIAPALEHIQRFFIGDTYLWSHGASFDVPLLDALFACFGKKVPWDYRNVRDTRTLFDLAGGKPTVFKHPNYVQHDALWDCWLQACQVRGAMMKLRGEHSCTQ